MFTLHEIWNMQEAYQASSRNNNLFQRLVESIQWDDCYTTEDETTVYEKGNISLEVHSLDVFDDFVPSILLETESGPELIHF